MKQILLALIILGFNTGLCGMDNKNNNNNGKTLTDLMWEVASRPEVQQCAWEAAKGVVLYLANETLIYYLCVPNNYLDKLDYRYENKSEKAALVTGPLICRGDGSKYVGYYAVPILKRGFLWVWKKEHDGRKC